MSRGKLVPALQVGTAFRRDFFLCPGTPVKELLICMQVVTFALFSGMIIR